MKNTLKEYSKYIVRIPIDTHKKAKVMAANKGVSLERIIIESIEDKVSRR